MPTQKDIIYAAGFLDADGSISILLVRRKYGKLVVQVTGKSKLCPSWFKDTFGGHVYIENHKNRPPIYYKWMVLGGHASQFLELVVSFLKLKQQQALLGIEFQTYKRPQFGSRGLGLLEPKRQQEIRETIMRLNKGGGENGAIHRPKNTNGY